MNQTRVTSSFYRNHFNDTGSTALTTYLSKNGILYCWSLPTFITDQLNIFVTFISTRLFPWLVYSLLCLFVCLLSFLGGRGRSCCTHIHSDGRPLWIMLYKYIECKHRNRRKTRRKLTWTVNFVFFFLKFISSSTSACYFLTLNWLTDRLSRLSSQEQQHWRAHIQK